MVETLAMRTRSVESRHIQNRELFSDFIPTEHYLLSTYYLLKYTLLRMTLISVAFKSPSQPLLIYWWNPDVVLVIPPTPIFGCPAPQFRSKMGWRQVGQGFSWQVFFIFGRKFVPLTHFFMELFHHYQSVTWKIDAGNQCHFLLKDKWK